MCSNTLNQRCAQGNTAWYRLSTLVVHSCRAIQFSDPRLSVFSLPLCEGEGEGGGAGRWSAQAVLLPPIPTFPPREGGRGRRLRKRGENRELNSPGPTAWPLDPPTPRSTAGGPMVRYR